MHALQQLNATNCIAGCTPASRREIKQNRAHGCHGSCLGSELGDTQNGRSFIHIRLALAINGLVRPVQFVSIAVRDFPQQINAHAVAVDAYDCACVCVGVCLCVCGCTKRD